MTLDPNLIRTILDLGVSGLLIVAVVAFARGYVVPGSMVTEARQECSQRVEKLEAKLDESSDIIVRQSEAQRSMIASQQAIIETLHATLSKQEGNPR